MSVTITCALTVACCFFPILIVHAYENCVDVEVYSIGRTIIPEFLGLYFLLDDEAFGERSVFSHATDARYQIWWTHFRGHVSRWNIGTSAGHDESVIAFKDSHALHPSEIPRTNNPWKVLNHGDWVHDEAIAIKCAHRESIFEWEHNCYVLGITNTFAHLSSEVIRRIDDRITAVDYMQTDDNSNEYYSASTKLTIAMQNKRWNIIDRDDEATVYGTTTSAVSLKKVQYPNGINAAYPASKSKVNWKVLENAEKGNTLQDAPYMAINCENAGPLEYYKRIQRNFVAEDADNNVSHDQNDEDVCDANEEGCLNNKHFQNILQSDLYQDENEDEDEDENDKVEAALQWRLSSDMKHFEWQNDNSISIPSIGIGTAGLNNDEKVIRWAVNKFKYKLIDSASDHAPWYQNEHIIGELSQAQTFKREEITITTKLFEKDHGIFLAAKAINDSLRALQTEFIDIYLIHHMQCDNDLCSGSWKTSWRIMEDFYFANKLKYIGVSNIALNELHELLDWSRVPIAVVQNWLDPFHASDMDTMIPECKQMGILFQAYSLLGSQHKRNPVFSNPKLKKIASQYSKKSIAQVVIRWALQNGVGVLPRSSKKVHIKQNMRVFDFQLSERDMSAINTLALAQDRHRP